MELIEVSDRQSAREFLAVARIIYRGDANWVCPLDKDIEGVFDPGHNPYFAHGAATRWVLKDPSGTLIGRIAAFVDHKAMNDYDQPTGCCGFFECIDDQAAAGVLFNAARDWLNALGLKAMNGPVNFGETDQYWGLLVGGFTQPAYKIAYNPPYYQQLFETYGFRVYYRQEGFHFDLEKPVPERFWKIAERVAKNPDYVFEHLRFANIDKYAADFIKVFNEAWSEFKKDFEPLEHAYVRKFLSEAKVILEERFIWFGYSKGEAIAIYLMYPDVNQLFKSFNGKLGILNKLRVLYGVKTKKMTRARGVLMGVIPRFQKRGIESAFIWHLEKELRYMPQYKELEFSWVGDFNPPMRKLWCAVGAEPCKHYITYRYLFDPDAEFRRYPIPESV